MLLGINARDLVPPGTRAPKGWYRVNSGTSLEGDYSLDLHALSYRGKVNWIEVQDFGVRAKEFSYLIRRKNGSE